MKRNIPCRLVMFGTALLLSALTAFPAFAAAPSGHLDTVSANAITGWAWDSGSPEASVNVELTVSDETRNEAENTVLTVTANQFRDDLNTALGSGAHGFVYEIDWSKYAAGTYTVTASAISGETKTPLIGSITYKKEDTSAPAVIVAADATETPAIDGSAAASDDVASAKIPVGPGSDTSPITSAGPGAGLTREQIGMGPGYVNGLSSNNNGSTKKAYGPGAASYETGEADQYLGSFHATAYCGCDRCSGGHALTYSGTVPQPNHTIAADLDHYPLGTKLLINGIVYTVEDKGTTVVDNRLDIFFATHEEALAFGLQDVDVYSVK